MAPRLSREERLERLIAKTRQRIDAKPGARALSQTPDSKLATLVRDAGYQRTSLKLLEDLQHQFREAGIQTFPDLTDPSNDRSTRIYFFDADSQVPGFQSANLLFGEEKQLARFLWMNRAALPYLKKANLVLLGQQVPVADGCVVDVLAENKKTRELVGIELKAGEADDRLVGQAAKYMRALKAEAAKRDRPGARLLIVSGQPDQALADRVQTHAEKYGVPTTWLLYRVSMALSEA